MKVAFITGLTGQDGSYLAEFLLKKNYIVHGIKRRSSTINTERIDHLYSEPQKKNKRLIIHYGDLTDSLNILRLLSIIKPDEIYNLTANKSYSIKKIINIAKVILKKEFKTSNKSKILYNCKKKILKTDLRNFKGVSNFYQSVSGWAPTTSFFNGLKMLIFLLKNKF